MKKPARFLTLFLLQMLFFTSCNQSKKSEKLLDKSPDEHNDLKKEIPVNPKGNPVYFYQIAKIRSKELNLDSIESGFDSLQIRLWYHYSIDDNDFLIVIKKNQTTWKGVLYSLKIRANKDDKFSHLVHCDSSMIYPKSGWISFAKHLEELNVTGLPDKRSINGYKDIIGAEGASYCVEVATKAGYRFYEYWAPNLFRKEYSQVDQMARILERIDNEFKIHIFK